MRKCDWKIIIFYDDTTILVPNKPVTGCKYNHLFENNIVCDTKEKKMNM